MSVPYHEHHLHSNPTPSLLLAPVSRGWPSVPERQALDQHDDVVASGQWPADSGPWTVDSGRWPSNRRRAPPVVVHSTTVHRFR
jgi:hypothetical protein